MTRPFLAPFFLPAALALSACAAGSSTYPSLALRDAERVHGSADPATADKPPQPLPTPASPPTDLAARLAGLVERADASHRRFESLRPGRAGAEADSIALGQLATARAQTSAILSEIDALDIDDRTGLAQGETASSPAIAAARDRVAALVREEDRVIAQFGG